MAAHCRQTGLSLRPHLKTTKSAIIGQLQIDAGAIGLCAATVGEAEALAAHGLRDIVVTSVVVSDDKFQRLLNLAAQGARLTLVVDSLDVAARLAQAAGWKGLVVPIYIDLDLGRQRSGVTSPQQALELATFIQASPALKIAGLQAYAGQLAHIESYRKRVSEARQVAAYIQSVVTVLESAGIKVPQISGGATGTMYIDPQLGVYTEAQYGSYCFMDLEYLAVDLASDARPSLEPALTVLTTVISKNHRDVATTDGGSKRFAGTLRPQVVGHEDWIYEPRSDEHGIIRAPTGSELPLQIGDVLEVLPAHCDPTVNLYDWYHVVQGDTLVAIWPVDARGA